MIFRYGPFVDVLAAIGPHNKNAVVRPHCLHSDTEMGSNYGNTFKFLGIACWIVHQARKCECIGHQQCRDAVRNVAGHSGFLMDSAVYITWFP
jgi:hypothetical protein